MSFAQNTQILGGVPAHHDLAPSVLFCIFYGLLIPLGVYRIANKASRSTLMIRPCVFVVFRIVTLAIRSYMSNGHYASGLFIAEIVLLTVGLIALLDPLIECFKAQVHPFVPPKAKKMSKTDRRAMQQVEQMKQQQQQPDQPKHWLGHVARFLRIGLIAILVTGIYAGSISGDAFENPTGSDASTLKTLRLVNYIVALAVLGILIVATTFAQMSYSHLLDARKSFFIIGLSVLLLIPSAYKLATTHQSSHWVHEYTAFYILLITPEWLCAAALLVAPATQWFPSEKARRRWADEEAGMNMGMASGGGGQTGSGEGLVQQGRY